MAQERQSAAESVGRATSPAGIHSIGVGMLGHGLMGKAHSNAYKKLTYIIWPPPLVPRLVSISGRDGGGVAEAAARYGFARYTTDWRQLVADPEVELFDNNGPNSLHSEPTIAAAKAGKHVICEKPLGRTAEESFEIWQQVAAAGVKHMCAFNYRFLPAVRLIRQIIQSDELGNIYHFRARYLQEWLADPESPAVWRLSKAAAGSGALGDLGSHVVDLARYLIGDPITAFGLTKTFVSNRGGAIVDVDDAFEAVLEFDNGAVGTVAASRLCYGRKNAMSFEINGSKGSVAFDLERLNELQLYLRDSTPGGHAQGFRTVLVSEAYHPFWGYWWPPGHIIGWEHTFVHEIHHLLTAIAEGGDVAPDGATLEDGYRAAEVCDAILRSGESGQRQTISYRTMPAIPAGTQSP